MARVEEKNGNIARARIGILALGFAVGLLLASSFAHAAITLKQIQAAEEGEIELLFDGKVQKNQIRVEYVNDIVQLVINEASVYPAKITSLRSGAVQKIFAYQYAPKVIRCRLTVKGKAEQWKNRLKVTPGGPGGKLLSIRLGGVAPVAKASKPVAAATTAAAENPATAEASASTTEEEKALLDQISKSEPPKPASVKAAAQAASATATTASAAGGAAKPLGNTKPMPSVGGAVIKLAGVVMLFLLCAWLFKKFLTRGAAGIADRRVVTKVMGGMSRGLFGEALKKVAGGAKREKMVEVVANHYLGPKKSISVVKVSGRTLVLGVTDEAINLITELDGLASERMDLAEGEPSLLGEGAGATQAGAPQFDFASLIQTESQKPKAAAPSNFRAQIRSRVEGMKSL